MTVDATGHPKGLRAAMKITRPLGEALACDSKTLLCWRCTPRTAAALCQGRLGYVLPCGSKGLTLTSAGTIVLKSTCAPSSEADSPQLAEVATVLVVNELTVVGSRCAAPLA